jgi:hypothetical protein
MSRNRPGVVAAAAGRPAGMRLTVPAPSRGPVPASRGKDHRSTAGVLPARSFVLPSKGRPPRCEPTPSCGGAPGPSGAPASWELGSHNAGQATRAHSTSGRPGWGDLRLMTGTVQPRSRHSGTTSLPRCPVPPVTSTRVMTARRDGSRCPGGRRPIRGGYSSNAAHEDMTSRATDQGCGPLVPGLRRDWCRRASFRAGRGSQATRRLPGRYHAAINRHRHAWADEGSPEAVSG